MHDDDLISGLNRQIKEEVIENYVSERQIIFLQIEDFEKRATETKMLAAETGKRVSRIAHLLVRRQMWESFSRMVGIPQESYWAGFSMTGFDRKIRIIRARALTEKGRFKKLLLESYTRLHAWMSRYREAVEDLELECRAVNHNIAGFHRNFDVLTILGFLRGLDSSEEKKKLLGENFSSEEFSSLEETLYIRSVRTAPYELPAPLSLPVPPVVENALASLAEDTYRGNREKIRTILK